MLKSITRALLTSTMSATWGLLATGECIVELSQRLGADEAYDFRAGLVEMSVARAGRAVVRTGEGLELFVNAVAMKLGYRDGEVSGMAAWPALDTFAAV